MSSKSLIVLLVLLLIGVLPRTVSSISMEELDATLSSLRSRGHNLFSNAITTSDVVFDLLSTTSITVLLPTESSLFALDMTQPANFYVNTIRCHVIPRRLTHRALLRLADGSYIPTLLPSREIRVSRRRVGVVDVVSLDGVDVMVTGVFYGRHVAVHGLDGIFSFRSLVSSGFNPQISPAAVPPSDEADRLPRNRSGSVSPAPEVEIVDVLSPDGPDLPILSPNSPELSPISESQEVSLVSEPPESLQDSPSPDISPSSQTKQSLDLLAEHDDPVSPSPSTGGKVAEAIEDSLPPTEMLWDTQIFPDFSESPEISSTTWSPEIPPSSGSFSADIAPSLQSKFSIGHLAPSVSSPENDDNKSHSPLIGSQFPDEIEEFLKDAEIYQNSRPPEISPSSQSEPSFNPLSPPIPMPENEDPASPSPSTGDRLSETTNLNLPPSAPEFLRDSFRDLTKFSPPAMRESLSDADRSPEISPTSHSEPSLAPLDPPLSEKHDPISTSPSTGERFPDTNILSLPPAAPQFPGDSLGDTSKPSPPAEIFEVLPLQSTVHIPPSVGFPGEYPAMKPPLKEENKIVAGVEMMAPEQSLPSTGETIECLVTGGDTVSCDLNNGHVSDFPHVFPR